MKKILTFVFLFVLFGCGTTKKESSDVNAIPQGPEGLKYRTSKADEAKKLVTIKSGEEGTFSSSEEISVLMNFLASDELKGRDSGSEGIATAATYIEAIFKENNVAPYFNSYKDTLTNFNPTTYNVVGYVEGNDPSLKNEFIILGAHYDHIGLLSSENGDVIANGANDNASGTSTVLELARYFGNAKTNKRSIIFALFSAEEKGLLGSDHLAKKLKTKNLNLYAMLNFEMTGVPLKNKDYFMYITGYEMSNLAAVSNQYASEKLIGFLPTAKEFNLFKRSDNYPFHETFGVPSHTYCTFDFTNFDHYHKVGDEVSLMDFTHMAEVVNKMIPVLNGIVNASQKEIKYN